MTNLNPIEGQMTFWDWVEILKSKELLEQKQVKQNDDTSNDKPAISRIRSSWKFS